MNRLVILRFHSKDSFCVFQRFIIFLKQEYADSVKVSARQEWQRCTFMWSACQVRVGWWSQGQGGPGWEGSCTPMTTTQTWLHKAVPASSLGLITGFPKPSQNLFLDSSLTFPEMSQTAMQFGREVFCDDTYETPVGHSDSTMQPKTTRFTCVMWLRCYSAAKQIDSPSSSRPH